MPGDLGAELKGHLDHLSRDRAVRLPPTLESPPYPWPLLSHTRTSATVEFTNVEHIEFDL
ncbi:hypothetical protein RKD45_006876 [Streptomyces griseus]